MEDLYNDLIDRINIVNKIVVNFTEYQIIEIELNETTYTFPTSPALQFTPNYLYLEIKNLSNKLRIKTLKTDALVNIDASSSTEQKLLQYQIKLKIHIIKVRLMFHFLKTFI